MNSVLNIIVNILFYIFGIGLPLLVIFVAIFKKSDYKVRNIIEKTIIAVIIFGIFYIIKLGSNEILLESENTMTNNNEYNEVEKDNDENIVDKDLVDESDDEIKIEKIDGVTYVNGVLIVNKTYALPEDYIPQNSHVNAEGLNYCTNCINEEAYKKYEEMEADAKSIGLNIWIQSGYRSYNLQRDLYNRYVSRDGKEEADTYSARPGHSEHQTGLAFDLNSVDDSFQYTDEGKWINENAYRYGYIIRYPKGKEDITGYIYESWHLRYVGVELATKLYNNGDWLTLEEYFNLTSSYKEIE